MTIASAQTTDAGDYTCVVTNSTGSATSNAATVAVAELDSDASAVLSALSTAGYTAPGSDRTGINNFVGALKAASIWSKMFALYGKRGSSAATHAINWKSPGANNITWSGTLTHDATGSKSDGSSGYGNTELVPSTIFTTTSGSLFAYRQVEEESGTISKYAIGSSDVGNTNVSMLSRAVTGSKDGGGIACAAGGGSAPNDAAGVATQKGFLLVTVNGDRLQKYYVNGAQVGSAVTATSGLTTRPMYALANNSAGTATLFAKQSYSLIGAASGLSASEVLAFNAAVQALQTAFNRAVAV